MWNNICQGWQREILRTKHRTFKTKGLIHIILIIISWHLWQKNTRAPFRVNFNQLFQQFRKKQKKRALWIVKAEVNSRYYIVKMYILWGSWQSSLQLYWKWRGLLWPSTVQSSVLSEKKEEKKEAVCFKKKKWETWVPVYFYLILKGTEFWSSPQPLSHSAQMPKSKAIKKKQTQQAIYFL